MSDSELLALASEPERGPEASPSRDVEFLEQVERVIWRWRAGDTARAASEEVRRLVLLADIAAGAGPPPLSPTQPDPDPVPPTQVRAPLEAQGRGFMHGQTNGHAAVARPRGTL